MAQEGGSGIIPLDIGLTGCYGRGMNEAADRYKAVLDDIQNG